MIMLTNKALKHIKLGKPLQLIAFSTDPRL